MRRPIDADDIAKLLEASRVMNPHYIEIHEGAYYESRDGSCRYYSGAYLRIEGGGMAHPPMKVTVNPPKTVPAKKPRKRPPKVKRLKTGRVILLKDKEPELRSTPPVP